MTQFYVHVINNEKCSMGGGPSPLQEVGESSGVRFWYLWVSQIYIAHWEDPPPLKGGVILRLLRFCSMRFALRSFSSVVLCGKQSASEQITRGCPE